MRAGLLKGKQRKILSPEEKKFNKEMLKTLKELQRGKALTPVEKKALRKLIKISKKSKKRKYWEKEDYSNALQYPRQQWPPY